MSDQLREALRPQVLAFAHYMEQELRANDHKGGWIDDLPSALLKRLREETDELRDALEGRTGCGCREAMCGHWPTVVPAEVVKEAADVANFAMMIADVVAPLSDLAALAAPSGRDPEWTTECITERELEDFVQGVRELFPSTGFGGHGMELRRVLALLTVAANRAAPSGPVEPEVECFHKRTTSFIGRDRRVLWVCDNCDAVTSKQTDDAGKYLQLITEAQPCVKCGGKGYTVEPILDRTLPVECPVCTPSAFVEAVARIRRVLIEYAAEGGGAIWKRSDMEEIMGVIEKELGAPSEPSRNPADVIADVIGEDPDAPNVVAARAFCNELVEPSDLARARAICYRANDRGHDRKKCRNCERIAEIILEERQRVTARLKET